MDKNDKGFVPPVFSGSENKGGFRPPVFPGADETNQSYVQPKGTKPPKIIVEDSNQVSKLRAKIKELEDENDRLKNLPREKEYVERIVDRPVEKVVYRDKIVEKPVDKIVTKTVEKPVEVDRDIWMSWIVWMAVAFVLEFIFFGIAVGNVVAYGQLLVKIGLALDCLFIVAFLIVNIVHFANDEYFEYEYDEPGPICLWVGLGLLFLGGAVLSCLVL